MTSLNKNKSNKIYGYIIILISLFIFVLFTWGQLKNIQVSLDDRNDVKRKLENTRTELTKLNDIEHKLKSSEIDLKQYVNTLTEDKIIDYIYGEIEKENKKSNSIIIVRSVSMKEGKMNDMGFNEMNITLNLRVPNEDRMYEILDFFVKQDSTYKFFIDSFTYPNNGQDADFNITIPLKVFYK